MSIQARQTEALLEAVDPEIPSATLLRLFYLFFLGAIGTQVTYLPLALEERGVSLAAISALFSIPPLVRLLAPSIWGFLADRFNLTSVLLRVTAFGTFLCYLPMGSGSTVLVGASLLGVAIFRTPAGMLADTLVFRRVAATGGSYGEIRAWGTVGYVAVTFAGGVLAARVGPSLVVTSGSLLLLVAALLTLRLPRPSRRPAHPIGPAFRAMIGRRSVQLFLLATALHTIGQATYDSFFPIHLERLGIDKPVIGLAVALGAAAEVGVMWVSGRILSRFGVARVSAVGSGVAAVRWVLNMTVVDPVWLVAIQLMHGVTFGAWYVAGATWLNEEAPEEVRASAQGLFSVFSFGLGGLAAMGLAGWVGSIYGTGAQFGVSAGAAALACLIMAWALPRAVQRERAGAGPESPSRRMDEPVITAARRL